MIPLQQLFFFFFNDTATTEIYTLSLHDALPISSLFTLRPIGLALLATASLISNIPLLAEEGWREAPGWSVRPKRFAGLLFRRSEEHTSELQSRLHLVCRLLLEKKKSPSS